MGFHYGLEKRKFDKRWAVFQAECTTAGMSEADIQEMYDFDWAEFKRERVFRTHNQSLCGGTFAAGDDAEEGQSPLFAKFFDQLSVWQDGISAWGRHDWIEDIDTPELALHLKSLPQRDIEMLTYLMVDGFTQTETARELGISRTTVAKRIAHIRDY